MFWGFGRKNASETLNTQPYRAFSTRFDQEVTADELREKIAYALPDGTSLNSLTAELRAPTVSRIRATQRSLEFQTRYRRGHDLGDRPYFTLLIDHSGSMRGPKAMAAAIVADIVGGILEHGRRPLDVLGFTTSSWKGGMSRILWRAKGSPMHPGRLCDLLHIVYADGAKPTHQWANNLALMLVPDVLKENVDGEALLWARERAEASKPTGWVCLHISDGAPVDDSTIMENGGGATSWYLASHLKTVVESFNADPRIRLGCLSLDRESDIAYRATRVADVLDDAAIRALEVLEELIWPASPS